MLVIDQEEDQKIMIIIDGIGVTGIEMEIEIEAMIEEITITDTEEIEIDIEMMIVVILIGRVVEDIEMIEEEGKTVIVGID